MEKINILFFFSADSVESKQQLNKLECNNIIDLILQFFSDQMYPPDSLSKYILSKLLVASLVIRQNASNMYKGRPQSDKFSRPKTVSAVTSLFSLFKSEN